MGDELVEALIDSTQETEEEIAAQRQRVAELNKRLAQSKSPAAARLSRRRLPDRKSVWSFGGDGWAYDIGFGGLDHVFASGRDVNILVLDTEVYSNTGGQASKATPRGAVANSPPAASRGRKDLGMIAMSYGNVFVGQIAMGANPMHAMRTIREAESYPRHVADHRLQPLHRPGHRHGDRDEHQKDAVACGYWPLYRFDPREAGEGIRSSWTAGSRRALQGVRHEGSPLRHAGPLEAGGRGAPVQAGAAGHRRSVALLRAVGPSTHDGYGRKRGEAVAAESEGGESMSVDLRPNTSD